MKKVIVIGCPGAGKSTFSRKLSAKTGLPLYYLDMIWHRPDRTVIGREKFDNCLAEIIAEEKWILDGNYARTLPLRLAHCDIVFFFDLPLDECIEGAKSRLGKERVDMPWTDDELDPEFLQWIMDFPRDIAPEIKKYLECFDKSVIRFRSRTEADNFIDSL
ncbi:MAG: adenylate kinase [Lachnospiraceae bacterium]|nr:adenylate kinase [Lachnospiraceae bacterium]